MEIEKALQEAGTFGIWHVWVYFWIFYITGFGAMLNLCIIFMQQIPDFICENPLSHQTNWTFDQIRQVRYKAVIWQTGR